MARITCSVASSRPLSSATCHCPKGSWTKWPQLQGWWFCMTSATRTSTHQGWPGYSHCWMPNLAAAEKKLSPQSGTTPWGDQPVTWWEVDYIVSLPSWKGQCFVLTGIDTFLGIGLPCQHKMLLPKLLSMDLQNASPTIMVLHIALFLIKGVLHGQRSVAMSLCSWDSLVLPCSSPSRNSWINRMMGMAFWRCSYREN